MPHVQTADHTSLFYSDWGSGNPVVFVSSAALSCRMWEYQTGHLVAHGMRCVTYDRRGQGRSDQPCGGYDYDTLADDLALLIEHLDLTDVTLVGQSMGGGEVVRYLTRHGSRRIARIALLSATTPFPLKTADNPDGVPAEAFEAMRAAWLTDFPRWAVENSPPFFGQGLPGCDVSPELRDWVLGDFTLMGGGMQSMIGLNRAMVETDFRRELPMVDVPALIVHGDHDASAPLDLTGRRTAALIPESRLVVYENAPHALYLTHTDRLNADLLAFIEGRIPVAPVAAA